MAKRGPHLTPNQARGGSMNHVTRYVLSISMVLVVILFIAVVFIWR